MADTYRIGKDRVKVTFPSSGYTYREGKDGRVVAFPSSGYTYKEGKNGRVVAFPSSGYTYREGKDGKIVSFLSSGYTYKEGKDGRVITFPSSGYTYKEGKDGRVVAFPSSGYTYREGKDGRVVAFPSSGYTYTENKSGRIVAKKNQEMDYNEIISNGKQIIKTSIDGDFEGFDDENLFPLYNGQYWIQKNYKYWYHYSYMAKVTIYEYKNSHFLTIDGQNQFVEIELIDNVIESTIVNDFNGWSGDTIFELENGQIWKQCEYDYNYSYRPNAIIYSNGYDYKILVEGNSVGVKRLK